MYTHTHTHSNIVQPSTALGFLTELILCILVFSHVHPPDLGVAYKKKKKTPHKCLCVLPAPVCEQIKHSQVVDTG